MRHVVLCILNGRRMVIFSGGPAETDEVVLNEIRATRDEDGFRSIIGRNSFQRDKPDALRLLDAIIKIYAGKTAYLPVLLTGKTMIRAVIFDLDGTLVQSEKLKAQSYAIAAQQLLSLPEPDPRAIEAYRKIVGSSREVASR